MSPPSASKTLSTLAVVAPAATATVADEHQDPKSTAFLSPTLTGPGTVIYPNEPSLRVSLGNDYASLQALRNLVYITDSIIPDHRAPAPTLIPLPRRDGDRSTAPLARETDTECEPLHVNAETRTGPLGDLACRDHYRDSSEKSDIIPDPDRDGHVSSDDSDSDSDSTQGGWACDCVEGQCDTSGCECVATFGYFYKSPLRSQSESESESPAAGPGVLELDALPSRLPLVECGDSCQCGEMCRNRITQRGLREPIHVHPLENASIGLGAFYSPDSPRPLVKGTFICLYAGEYLSTPEANARWASSSNASHGEGQGNYILTLRLPDQRIHIDPRHKGNVGRFFNHSCEPSCVVHVVRWGGSNVWSRAAIFAKRDIQPEEELTYDYADASGDAPETKDAGNEIPRGTTPCLCGSRVCRGWMPYDPDI